jgi:uncharacterized protein YkwD
MLQRIPRAHVKALILLAALAVITAPAKASAATPVKASAASAACPKADELPGRMTVAEVKVATLCLINAERRERGLKPLRQNRRLAAAGKRHVKDMVRTQYFAHNSRSGKKFSARIMRTGYAARDRALLGENLAWGTGDYATPARIVRGWMKSPGHRANILRPEFREIGIAIERGTPSHGDDGATYATEFGRRY